MNIAKQSTFRQLLVILFCFLSFASLESVAICEVDLAPSKTAVHLTNQVGKEGIEASRYLNGPSSAWTFASESVPKYGFTKFIKSLVRPSRLTNQVENINAAGLVKPTVIGPWSLFQRISGVRRTPGPGTFHIDTGVFHPKQLYDPLRRKNKKGHAQRLTRGMVLLRFGV